MSDLNNIRDDEFRVIGRNASLAHNSPAEPSEQPKRKPKWKIFILVIAVIAVIATVLAIVLSPSEENIRDTQFNESISEEPPVVFEPMEIPVQKPVEPEVIKPLGDYSDTTGLAYTEHLKDTINDIPLDIYIPHNAVPELMLGVPSLHDKSIVLTTQAADIRADNGKIVGAFVLKGEPLSWGLSKRGYCGIIDGELTVGVADNSPLFEEATETGGYFFRQYPLVDNGTLVENEPKGKSIRKALCDRNGEIMVVMSTTPESFHDFSQALIDIHVDNAIYLVGSTSFGYFRDKYDHLAIIYNKFKYGYKNENFIVWRVGK